MSSPFTAFRKYQAVLLAVFGVLIMIVFVVGDSLSRIAGGGGAGEDPVVVKWDGGSLKQSQLYNLRDMRAIVGHFLARAQSEAILRGAFPEQVPMLRFGGRLPVEPIISDASLTNEGTVRTLVMAEKAHRMGFVVSDSQITDYLLDLVDRKLTRADLKSLIEGGGKTRRNSVRAFYDLLRQEMLANNLYQEFVRGSLASPPAQRLDYYSRLNRQIQAEILAIPAESFLDKVAQPTEEELAEYFEQFNTRVQPMDRVAGRIFTSPDPGFKLPRRISIEGVQANAEDFIEEVRESITEEDIKAYYEKEKNNDEKLHAADELALPPVDESDEGESSAAPPKPADDSGSGEDDSGSDSTDEDSSKPDEGPAPPDSSDAENNEKQDPAKPNEPGADDSSLRLDNGTTRFTFLQSESENSDGEAADPETKADPAETSPENDPDENSDGGENKSNEPAGAEDSESSTEEGDDSDPNSTTTDGTETDDGKEDTKDEERNEPRYKPLEEVRDYIELTIAEQRSVDIVAQKLGRIRASMDSYNKALVYAEEGAPPRQRRPDIQAFAEKEGLKFFKYELISGRELIESTEVGKSYREVEATPENNFQRQIPFVSTAFRDGEQTLFQPKDTQSETDLFLWWKTEALDEEVPEWDDQTREVVARSFRLGAGLDDDSEKARGLARDRAEQLAGRLRDGTTFEEIASEQPGSEVVETDSFSWLVPGPRLSEIEGIDEPGPDFMADVFRLRPDEVGVVMNYPRTHAYVVRVNKENKSPETIQQNFLDELQDPRVQGQVRAAAALDWQKTTQDWFNELEQQFNVVWTKPELRFAR